MQKKKRKKRLIFGCFYPAGLAAGILIMLAIPYFSHRQELINIAETVAGNYEKTQDFGIVGYFGMNYLVFDLEGNCIDKVVSGFSDMTFHIDTDKYRERMEKEGPALYYDCVEIVMQSSSRRQLSLVAAAPIRSGEELTGFFFLVRELEEAPANLAAFILLWSFIFLLLFLFFYIVDRKEAELEHQQRLYIASMNHELKSPITSIKALTETLLDGYAADPQKQLYYYSTILKETKNLEETVQKILELSRLQSQKTLYQKENAAAEEVFAPVLSRYTGLCEDMDIRFLAPDPSALSLPPLYTAPPLASRVLDLLLHNAVKFVDETSGRIEVDFEKKQDFVLISVRDNGCGIPADAIPHIFDRFYQANEARSKNGSGLGLSIVKEILDGLGEQIQAESEAGKGSVFRFTISTAKSTRSRPRTARRLPKLLQRGDFYGN